MTEYIDFDLQLSYYDARFTAVVIRVVPGDKVPKRYEINAPIQFDFAALREAKGDPAAYGRLLTEQLFASGELGQLLAATREATAANKDRAVRLRLSVSKTAAPLHEVRWETMRDPANLEAPLLMDENIVFSRNPYTGRGKPVRDEPPADLKALVAIASPVDLELVKKSGQLPLVPIDYPSEMAAARERLAGFTLTFLAERGAATIDGIFDAMRKDEYDVLYLVCHGGPSEMPRLVLEDEAGNRDLVDAAGVVERMNNLLHPPPLVVLASCRSGGATHASSGESISRIGPMLAMDCGIPVVLAMQGDVSIESASTFLTSFFENMRRDGEIDHAVAVARGAIRDRVDAWMPVLYMRLSDGRLWSQTRKSKSHHSFEKWDSLLANMSRGKCTPIIGFGVYEDMFGDASTLARRWGETFHYPFQEDDQLPQIAQYLAINQDGQFPRQQLIEHYRREILRRFGDKLPANNGDLTTDQLITLAWRSMTGKQKEKGKGNDAHRILANLPCSLYITANASTVLESALEDVLGFAPHSGICRWNNKIKNTQPLPDDLDVAKPLVYHLFGRLDQPSSIVVTEDNYFDYLSATAADGNEPSAMVRGAPKNSSIMLLGFRVTDWNLRVLFRTLMKERAGDDEDFTHVAVQVDPSQPGVTDEERLYSYLDEYFGKQDVTIFRGSVSDFIDELTVQWKREFGHDLAAGRAKVKPT